MENGERKISKVLGEQVPPTEAESADAESIVPGVAPRVLQSPGTERREIFIPIPMRRE